MFDRIGRHSELTAFGREMLGRARALVAEADELRDRGRQLREGAAGTVRVGLGSGPGAMLMTPFLQHMTVHHPGVRTEVARGSTDLLVHSLRERLLDALVVDLRALRPAPDLALDVVHKMRAAFMCRTDHPLARLQRDLRFEEVQRYPVASTPLSDQVAWLLVETYGATAHPRGSSHCSARSCPASWTLRATATPCCWPCAPSPRTWPNCPWTRPCGAPPASGWSRCVSAARRQRWQSCEA